MWTRLALKCRPRETPCRLTTPRAVPWPYPQPEARPPSRCRLGVKPTWITRPPWVVSTAFATVSRREPTRLFLALVFPVVLTGLNTSSSSPSVTTTTTVSRSNESPVHLPPLTSAPHAKLVKTELSMNGHTVLRNGKAVVSPCDTSPGDSPRDAEPDSSTSNALARVVAVQLRAYLFQAYRNTQL